MKKQDKTNLHQLTVEELKIKAQDLVTQLKQARMEHIAGKLKNVRQLNNLRKSLAQVLTITREKELI